MIVSKFVGLVYLLSSIASSTALKFKVVDKYDVVDRFCDEMIAVDGI